VALLGGYQGSIRELQDQQSALVVKLRGELAAAQAEVSGRGAGWGVCFCLSWVAPVWGAERVRVWSSGLCFGLFWGAGEGTRAVATPGVGVLMHCGWLAQPCMSPRPTTSACGTKHGTLAGRMLAGAPQLMPPPRAPPQREAVQREHAQVDAQFRTLYTDK
jgi:hypothetical protein